MSGNVVKGETTPLMFEDEYRRLANHPDYPHTVSSEVDLTDSCRPKIHNGGYFLYRS